MLFCGFCPSFWSRAIVFLLVSAGSIANSSSEKAQPGQDANSATPKGTSSPAGARKQGLKKTKTARPGSSAPPQVMSKAEAERRHPRSTFLRPPGSTPQDRYAPDDDWADLPPWRQTSFFGIHARGQFFIFVLDQSGSMIDDDRLTRAKIELRKSVFALQAPQRFEVIFYNDQATPMPGGPLPRSADQQNKDQLMTWLHLIDPDGETNPRSAMGMALALRPDAVFLLSDGEFPEGTVESIAKLNPRKIPIHCVDLTGGKAGDHLQRIARDSGGQYASRPGSLQAAP
jgi:hypothetical protein